jgi:hypothetical protein
MCVVGYMHGLGLGTLHDNTACELLLLLAILLLVEVWHSLDTSVCGAGCFILTCCWPWRSRRRNWRRDLWNDCVATSRALRTSSLTSDLALDACKWPRWRQVIHAWLCGDNCICLLGRLRRGQGAHLGQFLIAHRLDIEGVRLLGLICTIRPTLHHALRVCRKHLLIWW